MKKRILSMLFALLLLCTACTSTKDSTDTTAPIDTTSGLENTNAPETTAKPVLIPENFGGYVFNILTSYPENETNSSLFADERNSSQVNDKIALRNEKIEKEYNVKLVETISEDPMSDLTSSELSSSPEYDALILSAYHMAGLVSSALVLDMTELDKIDITAPYFDAAAVRDLSLGTKLYTVSGDLLNCSYGATSVVICDNALVEHYNFKSAFGKSLDQIVANGEWTIDVMKAAAEDAKYIHANSDEGMLFGLAADIGDAYSLSVGVFGTIFEKDKNDLPLLNVTNDGFTKLLKKISEFSLFEDESLASFGNCSKSIDGSTLFAVSSLEEAAIRIKSGQCISILPMPKADKDQQSYACRVSLDHSMLAGIPASAKDSSISAAILSALFEGSTETTKAEYFSAFENGCTHKLFSDLSVILESRKYDLGDLFSWGDFDTLIKEKINSEDLEKEFSSDAKIREQAAEKAMDIVLKRLLGDDYKEEK